MFRPDYIPSLVMAAYKRTGLLTNKATWVLVVLSLAVLAGRVAPVYGQEITTITGQVVNGTAGASIPQEMTVVLDVFQAEVPPEQRTADVDSTGRFVFEAVPEWEGATYTLTAIYLGIPYRVALSPQDNWNDVRLKVYEATPKLDDVSIGNNVMLVLGADSGIRTLTLLEQLQVINEGDQAFIPNLAQGSVMDLLRFPLGAGAFDLDVQADLPEGEVLQVDRGVALTTPVPPGEHTVLLSYKLPYTGESLDISRVFLKGVGSFRLLMPKKAGTVSSRNMVDLGVTTIGETKFRLLELTDISSGVEANIILNGLPQPSLGQRIQRIFPTQAWAIAVPGVLLLALTILLVVGLRQGGAPQPATAIRSAQDRTSLVLAIAVMDDSFHSGEIQKIPYMEQRGAMEAQLLHLAWQEETMHEPGGEPR